MFRVSLYALYFCWTNVKFGYYILHTSLWSIHFVAAGKLVQLQFPRAFGLFSKYGSRSPSTVLTRRLQKRLISQQIHVKRFGAYSYIRHLFILLAICCCFAIVISIAGIIDAFLGVRQMRRYQVSVTIVDDFNRLWMCLTCTTHTFLLILDDNIFLLHVSKITL